MSALQRNVHRAGVGADASCARVSAGLRCAVANSVFGDVAAAFDAGAVATSDGDLWPVTTSTRGGTTKRTGAALHAAATPRAATVGDA